MKAIWRFILATLITVAFCWGFYGTMTYVVPMNEGKIKEARQSLVSDKVEVLLNGAADSFEKGRYQEVVTVLELAMEDLVSVSGEYKTSDRWKIERIQFLLGKTYHKMENFDKAKEAYIQTLRLNPDHMAAKYNLEMIQAMGGGGEGGKKPDKGKIQPKI